MATQQLKLSRTQLAAFLKDPVSIKQFEQLFNTVADVPVTGGGVTYDDIPVVSPATITATLTRILGQLESIATAYPGGDKAWSRNELNDILTRMEALETDYPGNTKAWVKAQKFLTGNGTTTLNGALIITGNTGSAAGSISKWAGGGFTIWPVTGSVYDLSILTAAGAHAIDMPTGTKNIIFQGAVGFNGTAPLAKPTLNAAATDPATTMALVNQIRSALINYGLCQ